MSNTQLNSAALSETVRTIAVTLGITETSAAKLLAKKITITADDSNAAAFLIADELELLLARTFEQVSRNYSVCTDICIVIGNAHNYNRNKSLCVFWNTDSISIASEYQHSACPDDQHPLFLMVGACYAAAMVTKILIGYEASQKLPDPFTIHFHTLGVEREWLNNPLNLSDTYMAGAGAIGNGTVRALRHLNINGQLHIADADHVDDTNIQRQVLFTNDDIGKRKATALVSRAQVHLPNLKLIPHDCRLQNLSSSSNDRWLKRLIVCVDSRRARRELQNEIPREVFDASTTDIREVILHYHRQPTEASCMSCIYPTDQRELQREELLVSNLGISIDEVRSPGIDLTAAKKITQFLNLDQEPEQLVGLPCDTLFKQLCGQGLLSTIPDRQVLAPFAFISVLAGTLLALELVRRLSSPNLIYDNYWRISAWSPPISELRRLRRKIKNCTFCNNPVLQEINQTLWGTQCQNKVNMQCI